MADQTFWKGVVAGAGGLWLAKHFLFQHNEKHHHGGHPMEKTMSGKSKEHDMGHGYHECSCGHKGHGSWHGEHETSLSDIL